MTTRVLLPLLLLAAAGLTAERPLACDLKALTPTERQRHAQLSKTLHAAIVERKALADGYTFRIDTGKLSLVQTAEWIAFEHKCCPFFCFRLDVEENSDEVWLSLTGGKGVKAFIETEFR